MAKYLDQSGLSYFWGKLKALLAGYVPTTRKVNDKALSSDISLTYSDVGAAASSHEHAASDITSGTLSAARGGTGQTSVSAAANAFMVSLNTQNATSDVTDNTLIATSANTGETNTWYRRPASKLWNYIKGKSDALYATKSHTHSDYVPTSRTVNGKALSSDISLTASDVSALPSSTSIPAKTSDLTNDSGFVTSANVPFLRCDTAAATEAKTTTLISGSFDSGDLVTGAQVVVEFTYANGVASPTLSVNGTTAKPITRYGSTAVSTSNTSSWMAGAIVRFIYDGTHWMIEGWLNTTYSSMSVAEINAGTATTARLITPARLKTAVETWSPDITYGSTDLTPGSSSLETGTYYAFYE